MKLYVLLPNSSGQKRAPERDANKVIIKREAELKEVAEGFVNIVQYIQDPR